MTEHTPEEWHVAKTGNEQGLIIDLEGLNIAVVYDGEKHARLIAAAPDLLAALKSLHYYMHLEEGDALDEDGRCLAKQVKEAIAKAEDK